jgi:hypothetical protein
MLLFHEGWFRVLILQVFFKPKISGGKVYGKEQVFSKNPVI